MTALTRYLFVTSALLACACSGPGSAASGEPARPTTATHYVVSDSTSTEPGPEPTKAPGASGDHSAPAERTAPGSRAVSVAECEVLLDHFLALARATHAETVTAELRPTDEQLTTIRADLAPQFMPACATLDRATYTCELGAKTQQELIACSSEPAQNP
jgi:hypothetical protein